MASFVMIKQQYKQELTVVSRFDSSVGRGNLVTEIGVGRVIRGRYLHNQHFAESFSIRRRTYAHTFHRLG